jgi:hypothetical protein
MSFMEEIQFRGFQSDQASKLVFLSDEMKVVNSFNTKQISSSFLPLVSRWRNFPNRARRPLVKPLPLLGKDLVQVRGSVHHAENQVLVGRMESLAEEGGPENAALGPNRNNLARPLVIVGILK